MIDVIKEGKKFYCNVCDENPCVFIVNHSSNEPLGCPFDKKFDASWKSDNENNNKED